MIRVSNNIKDSFVETIVKIFYNKSKKKST